MSAPAPATPFRRFGGPALPRRRLICLPFAGGGLATYRLWSRSLPDDVEGLAVQLPGRELPRRGTVLDNVEEIVAALLPAVRSAADLPYAMFGHSLGALVAFELTVALEREGDRAPSHLFVSGRRPPDEADPVPRIYNLPDPEFLDELQRRYGAVPDIVRQEPDLVALLLPVLRADVRAYECYAPLSDHKVRCPVHVYGGLDDDRPQPDQLPGWQRVAEREVRIRLFPGGHFYLTTQREELVADIARHWTEATVVAERP
jgi:surfactin synthase thioesterase subunit